MLRVIGYGIRDARSGNSKNIQQERALARFFNINLICFSQNKKTHPLLSIVPLRSKKYQAY